MRNVVIGAAVAFILGFATSGRADAQIVYGYSVPRGTGIASGRTVYSPGVYQSYNSFYSPYNGVIQKQVYYSDMFGQRYGRSFAYNPWTGVGYNSGFYQPNYYVPPYGYGFFRRW